MTTKERKAYNDLYLKSSLTADELLKHQKTWDRLMKIQADNYVHMQRILDNHDKMWCEIMKVAGKQTDAQKAFEARMDRTYQMDVE